MGSSDRPESDPTVDGSAEAAAGRSWSRWLHVAWPVVGLALLVAAGFVLHRELGGHHLADILAGLRGIPPARILLAAALAGASYWLLGFYDVLALRYVRQAIPYGRTLFTAFVSYAFGHNLGVATLTGSAIRYRMYVSSGLSATEVATVAGFCTLTSAIGLVSLISAALLLEPDRAAEALHLPSLLMRLAGSLLAVLVLLYLVWASSARRGIAVRGWLIRAPGVKIALPQVALGAIDVGLAAAVLWAVLPDSAGIGLAAFAGLYAIAMTAGLISHIPGGLGVFETVILLSLPQVPRNELLGALLAYRAVYYLLPLVLAALLFGVRELQAHTPRLSRAGALASAWVMPLVPSIAGSMVLVAGVLLLLSGATPALDSRLRLLRDILPAPGAGVVAHDRQRRRGRPGRARTCPVPSFGRRVPPDALAPGTRRRCLAPEGLDFEEAFILGLVMGIVWDGALGLLPPLASGPRALQPGLDGGRDRGHRTGRMGRFPREPSRVLLERALVDIRIRWERTAHAARSARRIADRCVAALGRPVGYGTVQAARCHGG